jgi:hypothetical protein
MAGPLRDLPAERIAVLLVVTAMLRSVRRARRRGTGYEYSVPLDLVSGVDDDPAVLSVKDYLSLVHGAIETCDGLLDPWRA